MTASAGGVYKYNQTTFFDGIDTTKDIDVSAYMLDAQLAIWTLYDLSFNEIVGAISVLDSATIRITVVPALDAGNYQIVGLA